MKTLVRNEVLYSNMVAIADDNGDKITYKELAEEAEKFSKYIEERSVVFFLCDRQLETLSILYQILYLNRVPLLLAADIDRELLENLLAVYQPQYVFCEKKHVMSSIYCHELELTDHVLLKTGYKKYAIHPDIAMLFSTSGTTGGAKLVKLSYDNLYDNSEHLSMQMGLQSGQKGLSPLPVNHIYGFSFCLWHWHQGATLFVTKESVISNKFREFYEREKINNFAATPYIYYMMQRVRFWNKEKIDYLHYAMSGGERLPESDQIRLFSLMKDKFWVAYGQTECSCIISVMNFEEDNMKLGSVGKALDSIGVQIDSNTGELIVRSKSVSMGYVNDIAQLADGDVNQGVLHTGDVAYIDEDGCIYLKGRLTRYVKILGKRVSLDDLEKYLKDKFQNVEFACIGTDNKINVFYTGLEDDLKRDIPQMLDMHMKIPNKYIQSYFIEKIPRNNAGKVWYEKLREIETDGTGNNVNV